MSMYNEPRTDHPELVELDLFRTGEASADVIGHVESCKQCQASVQELREMAANLSVTAEQAPQAVDQDVLDFIRTQADEIRDSHRMIIPWRRVFVAAAAIIAICFALVGYQVWLRDVGEFPQPPEAVVKEDINGDGTVDIVDAFLLASRIEAKGAIAEEWDLNADGQVDQIDVDLIADQAVALAGEGR